MRNWPERKRSRARIEIIPMIDVMMFLLVFFVLISTNVLPALGLRVALPHAAAPDHLDEVRRVTVTVAKGGDVYLDAEKIAVGALADRLRAMETPGITLAVIIAGDAAAGLQNLVDVLDQLKAANVKAASIITKPK